MESMTSSHIIRLEEPLPDDESLLALAEYLHHDVRPVQRSLWFAVLDADRRLRPEIAQFEDLPTEPDTPFVARLGEIWAGLLDAPATAQLVLMLERPGAETVQNSDRAWHTALRAAANETGTRVGGFFLATSGGVRPLAPDDAPLRRAPG